MAIGVGDLALSLRIITTPGESIQGGISSRLSRLLAVAESRVSAWAPNAPEDTRDEAGLVLASYLYDRPSVTSAGYANAFTNSGAESLLSPWHVERAGIIRGNTDRAEATEGPGATPATPATTTPATATQVNPDQVNALIAAAVSSWAQTGNTEDIPVGKLDNVEPGSAGVISITDGRLPAPAVAMRLGWSETQTADPAVFIRAGNHPTDGASEGTTAGLETPVFPPALAAETKLYLHLWLAGTPTVTAIQTVGLFTQDVTSLFSVGAPLTVDSVAGTFWSFSITLNVNGIGQTYDVISPGPLLLTTGDVEDWAKDGNSEAIPADKLTNAPSGSAIDTTARTTAAEARSLATAASTAATAASTAATAASTAATAAKTTADAAKTTADAATTETEAKGFIADWAETANTEIIPSNKLPSSSSGRVTYITDIQEISSDNIVPSWNSAGLALGFVAGSQIVPAILPLGAVSFVVESYDTDGTTLVGRRPFPMLDTYTSAGSAQDDHYGVKAAHSGRVGVQLSGNLIVYDKASSGVERLRLGIIGVS